ncbi:MAG: DUF2793 domain-containing protein [Actinobacteria bacterium]|nr:DUF2793 domain-containing protein [Actinomycetota bacterium]
MTTPIIKMPKIVESQANKFLIHNEALHRIEAVNSSSKSRTLTEPPADSTPSYGDSYVVPVNGSGIFAGEDNTIAYYDDGGWLFIPLFVGLTQWIEDESKFVVWNGSQFDDFTGSVGASSFSGLTDTPAYTGQAGKALSVNAAEDSLEYVDFPVGGSSSFSDLTDTPAYTGQAGKAAIVNSTEDGLEYSSFAEIGHNHNVGDIDVGTGAEGQIPTVVSGSVQWQDPPAGTGGSSTFSGLSDTVDYTGQAGRALTVNSAEDGLEYVDFPSGGTDGGGASVTVSDTAPASPANGDLWWDSVGGNLYIYYQDGDSAQWVISTSVVPAKEPEEDNTTGKSIAMAIVFG